MSNETTIPSNETRKALARQEWEEARRVFAELKQTYERATEAEGAARLATDRAREALSDGRRTVWAFEAIAKALDAIEPGEGVLDD